MRKYTRDDLARAYNTFDLPLGTSLVEVMLRYRKLAPDTHPDRFFDPAQKKKAEEKLKKLNHAKDVLNDHFKGPRASHVEGDACACQPVKAASFNPGPDQAAKRAAAEEAKRKAAEAAKRAADAAAQEAAKKAAEEALKKATAEAEKAAAEKIQAAKKAAAEEAAHKAAQAAAEAERLAAAAEAAAQEAAETVEADARHEQRKKSEATRWFYSKVCAAVFLGIMTVAGASDLVKGPGRNHPGLSVTPSPSPPPVETKEQEDSFYRKEADRAAYDAKHRYDPEIDQCLNQIADDQKQIQEWQQEIDRLRQEPQSDKTAMHSLRQDMYETSLRWKSASDHLDALVQQHPEIASERISNRPAPPAVEALEAAPARAHWSPAQNQNQTQDTEKTRRHLI
ncbi:MAG TPA: DnaJ domain-containing protein [Oculatellaceae cyanobacterium]